MTQYLFLKTSSCLDYIHYHPFYINKRLKKGFLTGEKIKITFLQLDKKAVLIREKIKISL